MFCFTKENLYEINLHIPKPYCSLRVAHTTSVFDKYILHNSYKKIQSLIQKVRPQKTFHASKQHPITVKHCLSMIG